MAAKINRTGKTYGDLTVLETIPGSNSKADTYLVKCNCCGNTMIIGIDALLKGLKCKDCRGKDRKRTYQDLVGEEHNGIKVISLAEDAIGSTGHRNIRYNCMCSCGKEFVAYRSSLLRGKVKSCGCCKHITEASKMLVDNAEAIWKVTTSFLGARAGIPRMTICRCCAKSAMRRSRISDILQLLTVGLLCAEVVTNFLLEIRREYGQTNRIKEISKVEDNA